MAAPSVARILREVDAGFNMGKWEFSMFSISSWLMSSNRCGEVVLSPGRARAGPTKPRGFSGLLWLKKNDHYPWGKSLLGLGCVLVSSPVPPSYAPGGKGL
jgi:hypothetical protein